MSEPIRTSGQIKPTVADIKAFALRYGLEKLAPEHLERMAELAVYVGDLGRNLPRPAHKADAPAAVARFGPSPIALAQKRA